MKKRFTENHSGTGLVLRAWPSSMALYIVPLLNLMKILIEVVILLQIIKDIEFKLKL